MTKQTIISLEDSTQHFVTEIELESLDGTFNTSEEAVIDTGSLDALSISKERKDDFPVPKFDYGYGRKCAFINLKSINGVEISHRCMIVFDMKPNDPVLIGLDFLLDTNFKIKGDPKDKKLEIIFEHID